MLKYITAGESHGKCMIAVVEGFPAGVRLDVEAINKELQRRQGGVGRGPRMGIEKDEIEVLSGVRKGMTMGSPICMKIKNYDSSIDQLPELTRARPGHADLAGAMKYGFHDMRNVLERASARETAARVAAGALAKTLLSDFGIRVLGYVRGIGGVVDETPAKDPGEVQRLRDSSSVFCLDKKAEKRMVERIKEVTEAGDSAGGLIEVTAYGIPPGLGSYTQWDQRLDGRLAAAVMSVQAIKGVEIGLGFRVAEKLGSEVHDCIFYDQKSRGDSPTGGFFRRTDHAGGLEGGVTNGEPIVVRAAMKPIPTLRKSLESVDLTTKKSAPAAAERSDVCAVPAASVVVEAVVSFEIARVFVEKFGGDSIQETRRNLEGYLKQVRSL
ncbi:MAG TPA: chorismate synthase [Candidatus Avalokitesvara rifleensis]|uniref:chorismate synthase n=1 Tax=Candidatus Avalokitesvara rifleensis TaxID=3367620 RepID=UPI0027126B6D|nr:chorismate synthase [Candidatus Brocadiales bacterium]